MGTPMRAEVQLCRERRKCQLRPFREGGMAMYSEVRTRKRYQPVSWLFAGPRMARTTEMTV
jgi:hypothetical protein